MNRRMDYNIGMSYSCSRDRGYSSTPPIKSTVPWYNLKVWRLKKVFNGNFSCCRSMKVLTHDVH